MKQGSLKGNNSVQLDPCRSGFSYVNGKFGTGFDTTEKASFYPDMAGGASTLYVYCNAVSNQIVGDTMAPLLRTVNIEGQAHDNVHLVYQDVHYVSVLSKELSEIRINIRDDTGQLVDFKSGKVMAKLHFRRHRHGIHG